MENTGYRAIAIVGVGAVLPDAPNVPAFWDNVKSGRYSISETPPDRWDPALYYDADPTAPDKTYSKIGGWVREFEWDPVKWRLAIPPRVVAAMDDQQRWAIAGTREALEDYGYPKRPLNLDRTAVILGNAMAGEKHYLTALRIYFPEYARELAESASFVALPDAVRREITAELHQRIAKLFPEITEDSMPGELANCIAGRIANLYNFHGPNFTTDAACASAMAAISAATEGLVEKDFDVAVTGGIDHNMGASSFIKFCKIGALSATGTRPYAEGADGFVMGEGAAVFLMKRLADAERDGDNIYAVLRGIGASSDGKGKGITAPNPIGQKFCLERAWQNAGLSPATATLIEGHGTSTRVGDVVEVQSMAGVLNSFHLPAASVALGSVKSNIGHLKGAAGAAGVLKATLALRDKVLPPSLHFERPNPDIDFARSAFYVNTELKPWTAPAEGVRRAGVSAFGFGGTNFHVVLEEYISGRLNGHGNRSIAMTEIPHGGTNGGALQAKGAPQHAGVESSLKAPFRGALVIGADSEGALTERLRAIQKAADSGHAPAPAAPAQSDLRAPERLAIDYADAVDLADKASKALKALNSNQPPMWKALRAQGIFRGRGSAAKVAFLYTGQGSQYVNMLNELRAREPLVAEVFSEADGVMTPLLGKPLSEFIFVDHDDAKAVTKAEDDLRQTAITQPAVLATDMALTRLLAAYGIVPDMTMGHSLGEYGALVAAGGLPFNDALEAVSARGREMTRVSMEDNGRMAAVFAPLSEIERILKTIDGYVVIANINSNSQAVIGGASHPVERAMVIFEKAGYNAVPLPVSHAFHTSIVAPASEPLRRMLTRLRLAPPCIPIIANVSGEFYPAGPDAVPEMLDILSRQVASPVQFVKGLRTLYKSGARVFVEVGPKKALQGFADDVLGDREDVLSLFTNHPKTGDIVAFNQALCGLYAAGLGHGSPAIEVEQTTVQEARISHSMTLAAVTPAVDPGNGPSAAPAGPENGDRYAALGRFFANVLERGWEIYGGSRGASTAPVAITGASLGLPGGEHVFDDANVSRILRGDQFIDVIPTRLRRAMLEKHITRLVKSESGGPTFESITNVEDVIKLAARGGVLDLAGEFGVSAERVAALDRVTRLAIGAGIDALRDAGIPLVMRYKTTSKGTQLPDRWGLPEALRDDTGVIFASAFPGYDTFASEITRHRADLARREKLTLLESLRSRALEEDGRSGLVQEIDRRISELRAEIERDTYSFDRRFLFRILSMGHSQFAEFVGARGPNTQINSACASTSLALALAEDWISAGRCRRVIVVSADDVTSDDLMEWMGAGFLATGAAATDDVVEDAAIPFDRRRHGMIVGMGAAALVVESSEAARERGIRPICELLAAVMANSAFHGTRLDVEHISQTMETLIRQAEARCGLRRQEIAPRTVFVSHETYTPARGGSASAEIQALRRTFGPAADQIVIANTKGFTGHAMATGIEEVVAVKALETGCVPPVANFKEVDPELGPLNLSKGGIYPIEYALRLGAGFGSQVSMTLLRRVPGRENVRPSATALGYGYRLDDPQAWNAWLSRVAGHRVSELEVVRRTLRVPDHGAPSRTVVEAKDRRPLEEAGRAGPRAQTISPNPAPDKSTTPQPPATKISAPSVPAPAQQQTTAASAPVDPVKERILALVAEKTGYPPEMLDLDLDLEADLGVDTVKQAEVFASVREAYGIARDESVKLRDFPTLAHVIRFVHERRPDLGIEPPISATPPMKEEKATASALVPSASSTTPADSSTAGDPVAERILQLAVEKTGYPREMLDLDLDLEADLGVDTVKQAEMFAAIREIYHIARDENRKLRDYPTLAHVIRFVHEQRPDLIAVIPTPKTDGEGSPKTTVAPAPAQVSADDSVTTTVLEIVAEKTGYPKEMLDLDLDLEADLGIDTVKQAEMFASVRAAYNIPRDETLKLRDFPTLAHVIKFARDRQAVSASAAPSVAASIPTESKPFEAQAGPPSRPDGARPGRPTLRSLDAANNIPRRVPVPILRPPLGLCKSTGVKLAPGSRVIIMPDRGGVAEALTRELQSRRVEVLLIDDGPQADVLGNCMMNWLAVGPIEGVYWLPALDDEGDLRDMDLASWREALRVRVKSLSIVMRDLYHHIASPGTFLISATRLGGQHGYDAHGASAPLGGAVTGFVKAYKRERMDVLAKSVDFEAGCAAPEIARMLVEETLRDPGAIEIGHQAGLRSTVGLEEQPAADGQTGITLDRNTVFVVTGAAGSIVSAITSDLAAASGGTFYLLDVVPEPDPGNPDLKRFVNDKDGLRRDLFARIQARGDRATPTSVEKELAALERAEAARSAIDAIRVAGGAARYFSVNLTDGLAVSAVIDEIRKRSGRIDVLLHAAGVERSHLLADKDPREFDLVFDVKSDGWFNLLHAIGEMPLGATVAFSSVAGRFGNAGQADYSAANDLLCKITSSFRTTRPDTRGIAIDWTAWGGIGMATRGSIPKMMELAGIDMLAPDAGIPLIRRELTSGGTCGELVVGQRLGVLLNEWDDTGGLDPSALPVVAPGQAPVAGPMLGGVTGMGLHRGLTVETTLDPSSQAFLYDHQIEGTPVLPGVMGIEAFAEAAQWLLPGWHIDAVEDVDFLAPFKFYHNKPRTVTIEVVFRPQGDLVVAQCRLLGRRYLSNQAEPQVTTHFTGRVLLTRTPRVTGAGMAPGAPTEPMVEASDIYRVYFHGPAYKVLQRAWREDDRITGLMATGLPPNHQPSELPTLMAPRLIELCFQSAGIWEMSMHGSMGLPQHVDRVSMWRPPEQPEGHLYTVVTPDANQASFDAEVVDAAGTRYISLSGYRTIVLPGRADNESLSTLQTIMSSPPVLA
ncbi:MAG TPA: SDR family NAD(P)-dependent oxidoreductase [Terriglobia bacterium]|nr:SDR family NAD(P)-dependent oxidoreductase [Terriglobia bacterium]